MAGTPVSALQIEFKTLDRSQQLRKEQQERDTDEHLKKLATLISLSPDAKQVIKAFAIGHALKSSFVSGYRFTNKDVSVLESLVGGWTHLKNTDLKSATLEAA